MVKSKYIVMPVAYVANDVTAPVRLKKEGNRASWYMGKTRIDFRNLVSRLEFAKEHLERLSGIEDFSHLDIIFWPDRLEEERKKSSMVRPLGFDDLPQVGTFATRSPARPNPLLVTTVKLLKRENNVLFVEGLDALNGTPVMDVKPYAPGPSTEKIKTPDWMKKVRKMFESS